MDLASLSVARGMAFRYGSATPKGRFTQVTGKPMFVGRGEVVLARVDGSVAASSRRTSAFAT